MSGMRGQLNRNRGSINFGIYIEELQTGKCYNLSWNMEIDDEWWFWSLADIDTIANLPK